MEKINEFIAAIEREQAKRDITYPKMLRKMQKKVESNEATTDEFIEMYNAQKEKEYNLGKAHDMLKFYWVQYSSNFYQNAIEELVREMDMRLRYYPMMIMRHQISKEDAEKEKQIWRELVEYFNKRFTPSVEVKFLKTRCKIINHA